METEIPDESLLKWQKERERAERRIKEHTDDWVIAQQKLIIVQDAIKKLGKK